MRNKLHIAGLLLFGFISIFLFSSVECNSKEGEKEPVQGELCGKTKNTFEYWEKSNGTLDPASHYVYIEEGKAIYTYSIPSVSDVCTHKHISGSFIIYFLPDAGGQISKTAEVVYGILHTYPINDWSYGGSGGEHYVRADFDFGINHLYGDEPGWFFPMLYIGIDDQGSDENNHILFNELITKVSIYTSYRIWKDNSSDD